MADTHKSLRALIIEDSDWDLELVVRELQRGYDVTYERVETMEAMVAELNRGGWDVIVSDFSLPSFGAPAALAAVKARGLDLPFIIVSGTVGEENAVEAMRAGAHDFMAKDRLARLLPVVEREIREAKVREANRTAADALRRSEQRYRRIVETTNEGIWMLDAESRTTFVNDRLSAMLGHSPLEMVERNIMEFVHEDSRVAVAENLHLERASAGRQAEIRLLRGDGAALWVLLDSAPVIGDSGEHEGALAMVMDITERKRLEAHLLQSQKMEAVGSLAGGVAHDFNNMLSVIMSYSSLIIEDLKPGDPTRADVEEIQKAGERAANLTRQLLAFSRQQMLEPRILDLNHVVVGLEKMLRRLLSEDIELSLLTTHGLGTVHADPGQLEQVIMNLVVNARDAMPQGGNLSIETSNVDLDAGYAATHIDLRPGPHVMLAVTDTGVGMDSVTQARMFEPFFTTKEKGKGTGLGLSTVFGIIRQSGGHVWVYSEPGKGTTFKILLPRVDVHDEAVTVVPPAPLTLRGTETILLVEDEEQVRIIMRAVLRRNGYNVLEAQNGGEAFLICEQYGARIDLLLTDVIMPRMSGRELAERLAPMRPAMRVLYISGYTENAVVHHGVLDAGIAFLQKPITPDALLRRVREVLEQPARAN